MEPIKNLLPVNLELVKQELTPQRTGSELAVALKGQAVRTATVEDIKQVLRYAMVKVGLRGANFPNEIEKSILIDHVIQFYGNHSVDEIRLAFDMAIAGRLDLETKDVTCYENFSCLYFSTIMNAYRKWAKEEYKHVKNEPPMIEQKESLSDQAMTDWLEDTRKRKLTVELMPLMLYDFIDRKKMIVLSNDEKYEYLQRAASFRLSKLQKDHETNPTTASKKLFDEFLRMKTDGAIQGEEIDVIKNLAKKMVVYDYLYGSKT